MKRAWIENQYGEVVAYLRTDGDDEYNISERDWLSILPAFLCEGDTFVVKAKEEE